MRLMLIMFMTCNGNKLSSLNTKLSEQAVHIFFCCCQILISWEVAHSAILKSSIALLVPTIYYTTDFSIFF